jgi:mannose-6-phosphate isomerase-like protein (cupin superfamily)
MGLVCVRAKIAISIFRRGPKKRPRRPPKAPRLRPGERPQTSRWTIIASDPTTIDRALTSRPPLHVHHREDEAFYVLEGELTPRCGDRTFRATVFFLPRAYATGLTRSGVLL